MYRSDKYYHFTVALLIALSATIAWVMRWSQDDAYITYRYARNVADGLGAVWNVGQFVEGYTNFLWMALLAAASAMGFDILNASLVLGVFFFIGTLSVTYLIVRAVLPGWPSILLVALVATNYTMLMYATGGLETQLFALLTVSVLWRTREELVRSEWSHSGLVLASLLMGATVMTRPDGVVVAVICWSALAFGLMNIDTRPLADRVTRLLSLTLPATLCLAAWVWWKWVTYGHLAPNTAVVKLGANELLTSIRGLAYVLLFFTSYWLAPIILFLGFLTVRKRRLPDLPTGFAVILVYVICWITYVVWVGGDIMEFRHMVPAIPGIFIMVIWWMRQVATSTTTAVLILILFFGSLMHSMFFPSYVRPAGVGNIPQLRAWVDTSSDSWASIGRVVGRDLEYASDVTIAVTPAGAIPYYSRGIAVDMIGLNDAWIARNGRLSQNCGLCFAHRRLAPISYLKKVGTHLIIGYPTFLPPLDRIRESGSVWRVVSDIFWREAMDFHNLPAGSKLVRIPIADDFAIAAVYLQPHDRVDRLIESGRWDAVEIGEYR